MGEVVEEWEESRGGSRVVDEGVGEVVEEWEESRGGSREVDEGVGEEWVREWVREWRSGKRLRKI